MRDTAFIRGIKVRQLQLALLLACSMVAAAFGTAAACPFCTALQPTLSQRCDDAQAAALGEIRGADEKRIEFHTQCRLADRDGLVADRLMLDPAHVEGASTLRPGTLALMLARSAMDDASAERWEAIALDEAAYGYVAALPPARLVGGERLAYFAHFLEHANPLVAEDAYQEFGHADFDEVSAAAPKLSMAGMRQWLVDAGVPEYRKGFYAVALGLARDESDRQQNRELLFRVAADPADDFRAGFDGVLAGMLLLAPEDALKHIETSIAPASDTRPGDMRHALSALRFFYQRATAAEQAEVVRVARRLLAQPAVAAAAIVDLSRWQDWDSFAQVAGLFEASGYPQPETGRAVMGYLRACPLPEAAEQSRRLRQEFPDAAKEADAYLDRFGGFSEIR